MASWITSDIIMVKCSGIACRCLQLCGKLPGTFAALSPPPPSLHVHTRSSAILLYHYYMIKLTRFSLFSALHACMHTHARTRTHTHARTHARTHTHTHTATFPLKTKCPYMDAGNAMHPGGITDCVPPSSTLLVPDPKHVHLPDLQLFCSLQVTL